MKVFKIDRANFFIILVLFFLVFLNLSRNIDNDLSNYIEALDFFKTHTYLEIFKNSDFLFVVKPTEPIFYFFTYVLAKIFFGYKYIFLGVYTLFFYLNLLFGISKLLNGFGINRNNKFLLYCVLIFACINFSETSHLLRQYFAGSFLPLFIYYLINNKYFYSGLIAIIVILTHNSLSVILLLLYLSNLYFVYSTKYYFIIFPLSVLVFSLFIYYSINFLYTLSYLDEPSDINYISIYYDFVILFFYFIFSISFKKNLPKWNSFFLIFTLFFAFFLFNLTFSETVFLRFYINIEWFRFFYFLIIIISLQRFNLFRYLKYVFYLLVLLVFSLRLYVSPWNYLSFELFN